MATRLIKWKRNDEKYVLESQSASWKKKKKDD
jgi:hypothetical protein